MSFFIRGKAPSKHPVRSKFAGKQGTKRKLKNAKDIKISNDELPSSDDELAGRAESEIDKSSTDDENETAQEKKLRLAKVYLQEIEREEKEHLQDLGEEEDNNRDAVSKRLQEDYLKQAGKLRLSVADKYSSADHSNIRFLKCREQRKTVTCICVMSDNQFMFSGSKDGGLVKWSLTEKKKVLSLPFARTNVTEGHSRGIASMCLSSDNKYLVVGDESSDIQVWNPDNFKHVHTLKGHRASVTGLAFRKDTYTLYSCSRDRSIKVWSLDEMVYVETLYGHQDGITAIDALTRERAVTSGGLDSSIRIWKIPEESQLIYNGHSGSIDVVRLINEENFISGGDDGQLCVWSVLKKKPLSTRKEAHGCDPSHSQPHWITATAALINTDLVASGSSDGFVRLWKLANNFRSIEPLFSVAVTGIINSLVFTDDGQCLIAAVGREHRFGRWNVIKEAKNGVVIIPLLKS